MDIRSYVPGDETRILQLFRSVFGQDMTPEYWRWRFLRNPSSPEGPIIDLMWDGDLLAGHYAVSPVAAVLGGRPVRVALSMTTMTHPDYRGRGIFTSLAESVYARLAELGFVLVFGFPNDASHAGFVHQLKWRDVYEIPTMSVEVRPAVQDYDMEPVLETRQFSDQDLSFVENALERYHFRCERTSAHLQWRYFEHPGNDYVGFLFRGDGHGYAIAKLFKGATPPQVDMVDLVADSREASQALLRHAALWAHRAGAARVNLWLNRADPAFVSLERLGYVHGAPITWLGWRAFSPAGVNADVLERYDTWYVGMGDSDVY